jgi:bacteriochlorophyllide a dehydrogenase
MNDLAVVLSSPKSLAELELTPPADDDVVVDIEWSGISTGTERCCGRAHAGLPGMGYPLVPGYESVGRVVQAGAGAGLQVGEHGLRARRQLLRRGARPVRRRGVAPGGARRTRGAGRRRAGRAARAAGAGRHGLPRGVRRRPREPIVPPDLIVGHGVLGRLLAR